MRIFQTCEGAIRPWVMLLQSGKASEPGQPERRSPNRQELAPRAHRAELEFGAPVVEDAPSEPSFWLALDHRWPPTRHSADLDLRKAPCLRPAFQWQCQDPPSNRSRAENVLCFEMPRPLNNFCL